MRAGAIGHCHLASFYRRSAELRPAPISVRGAHNGAWRLLINFLAAARRKVARLANLSRSTWINLQPINQTLLSFSAKHASSKICPRIARAKVHNDIESWHVGKRYPNAVATCLSPHIPCALTAQHSGPMAQYLARAARPSAERRYLRSQQSFPRRLPRPMGAVWGAGRREEACARWAQPPQAVSDRQPSTETRIWHSSAKDDD